MSSSTYISQATSNPSDEDLLELLTQCHRSSTARGISGKLLLGNGTYLHCLEGEPSDVDERLAKIDADPRHTAIKILSRESVTTRRCVDWSVGSSRLPKKPPSRFRACGTLCPATSTPNTSKATAQWLTPRSVGRAKLRFLTAVIKTTQRAGTSDRASPTGSRQNTPR